MKRNDIRHILVLGSGPIVIGQACEFDYSGCQAVKALKEEGYEVSLVNPNPATVMTTPDLADHIFMEPLSTEYVEEIFKTMKIDAILSTMGGQSALNLTMELERKGILEKYGVKIIGATAEAIRRAEDREEFKRITDSLGLESAKSGIAHTLEEAREIRKYINLPIIIRPSFTLGGMGGGIIEKDEEFDEMISHALSISPVSEVLLEESLLGWREFEMEVMRDKNDNAIIVCSIENIDPMGVHTGDSITIAPIQTLTDKEYQRMRSASIDILRAVGIDCGGSNVQFALSPDHKRMIVIEMNPRVSRSSALASKATGYPIARISAKLAVGYTLDEIENDITGESVSCFEPALDYCAVKVPRFELEKFPLQSSALGTQMRSVGESLALGRTALEALNKAIRATEQKREGLETLDRSRFDVETLLESAHPYRLLALYTVIKEGYEDLEALSQKSGYDIYFLNLLKEEAELERRLESESLDDELYLEAKRAGLSDKRIEKLSGTSCPKAKAVRHYVDTCAGEFKARTPYCYLTYGEEEEGNELDGEKVIIVASGPNRIGQGLEFDTCCTLASHAFRKLGTKTIMVNSNPETVSTDYSTSDRLYIEPLNAESVLRVMEEEKCNKVVLQLGGQTPLNMASALEANGAEIIGTSLSSIDESEDRGLFSALVKELGLRQPENRSASDRSEIMEKAHEIGYPVLLRPSFVLGGRGMFIVYDDDGLEDFLERNQNLLISKEAPVLVDQFLEDAFEYDLDGVSDGENLYIGGIVQHIEAAGIHSGDSAAVFPPYKSKPEIIAEMREWTLKIARRLNIKGLMNMQFAEKDGKLYIIEVNPRGSRTVPFISKSSGVDLVEAAVKVWSGINLKAQGLVRKDESIGEGHPMSGWAIKEAVFSFDRFLNVDPQLGPEMRSTGESVGYGETFGEAYAKSQASAGNRLPRKGRVIISVNNKDRKTIAPIAKGLRELGFEILATRGTARDLYYEGILTGIVNKVHEGHPNIVDFISERKADLIINTPMGFHSRQSDDDIRSAAMRFHIPYTTTTSAASAALEAIRYIEANSPKSRELPKRK